MAKRRTFKPELKARVVLEELTGGKSTAEICREHQLKPQVFARWKVEFLERPWYFGSECDGGFAEYTVVASRHAYKIHSKFNDIELALSLVPTRQRQIF